MESTNGTAGTTNTRAEQECYHHTTLVDLPDELVLNVASFLDKESQLLLSLSCKQLHSLLNTFVDLAIHDRATKVRFLQRLQLDHPEYLTCRSCGFLYLWRRMQTSQYDCPRASQHQHADTLLSYRRLVRAGDTDYTFLSRNIVDLILQAYEHGPTNGLPLSFFNSSGKDRHGISRTNEARLIDGQLILVSRLELEGREGMAAMARFFDMELCLHYRFNPGKDNMFRAVAKAVTDVEGSKKRKPQILLRPFKCYYCETDHRLQVDKDAEKQITIVLNVWRNYGRRHSNMPSNEQHFHRYPVFKLDAKSVSKRDVRAVFESASQ
ncbi:hypothetical protein EDD37DRAFT_197463 [Exophiala viscosa]|uniref:F-box domain-containing protein n=1 Tax=Exophiala viscosa TaxID=2486360 RepID=A0AAN6DT81_9EURO|nr:hypothetical protein EDD36DRAFT_236351 [Exophiala viscosa]KAI1619919.1 hypothetical protein EDD37DRAFT_197463 [Exophiala viscosa]